MRAHIDKSVRIKDIKHAPVFKCMPMIRHGKHRNMCGAVNNYKILQVLEQHIS